MNVERDPAPRPEDAPGFRQCAPPRLAAPDHPQRTEHRQGIVKDLDRESSPAGTDWTGPSSARSLGRRAFEPTISSIGRDRSTAVTVNPRAGKPERVSARPAAQIHQPPRLDETFVEHALVRLKQRMVGKVGIFLRGQPRRVRVFPERGVDPSGRRQAGGTRVKFMERSLE